MLEFYSLFLLTLFPFVFVRVQQAFLNIAMTAYVCEQSPECIREWSDQLVQLPKKEWAEWRGHVMHSLGEVSQIRYNEATGIFEMEMPKAVEKHLAKAIPDIIVPPNRWVPIQMHTGKPLSNKIIAHYYGPGYAGPDVMNYTMPEASVLQLQAAFKDRGQKGYDELFKKLVEEEALKQETAKKTASQEEEEKNVTCHDSDKTASSSSWSLASCKWTMLKMPTDRPLPRASTESIYNPDQKPDKKKS
jgi:hypothetical protein